MQWKSYVQHVQSLNSWPHSHLIHVHVGLGPRASLPHDQRKVVIQLTRNDLIMQGNRASYNQHGAMGYSHFTFHQHSTSVVDMMGN